MRSLRGLPKNAVIRIVRRLEKAIKENCYDCHAGQKRLVCKKRDCPLYPFRPWASRSAKAKDLKDNQIQSLGGIND